MKRSFYSPVIRTGLFLATTLVILFGNVWILQTNFREVSNQEAWVRHTAEVINELDLYLSSIKDAETYQRGYLLTKDPRFVDPYQKSKPEIERHQMRLTQLLSKSPIQTLRLQSISKMTDERLLLLERHLKEFALNSNLQQRFYEGKLIMESIRDSIEEMKAQEKNLLAIRTEEATNRRHSFWWTLVLGTGFTALVIIFGFTQMIRNQIRSHQEAMAEANETWVQTQVADLGNLLAGDMNLTELSQVSLDHLIGRFNFLVGNFYVYENGSLRKYASHGLSYESSAEAQKNDLDVGSGLVGEAFRQSEMIEINEVPPNYMNISSSLGEASPNSILFIPLRFQRRNVGVIELGSFSHVSHLTKSALEHMKESLGIGLNAAISRESTQQLLEKTQQQAEELQAQQEELRTSNEELEQQTRALENQQATLSLKNKELESTHLELAEKARELERTNQYKSEFLAKMSHELRTPLNSLLILASLLTENKEKNLNDQQKEFAKSIYNAGHDLLNLINDILDLSKIEARKLRLRPEPFSLGSLLEQIRGAFGPAASAKKLDLKIDASSEAMSWKLFTDRQRLEQILRNFLSNAIKFTEKGHVTIEAATKTPDRVQLTVADSGVGIPADKQNLIFEAFEQADGSVSRKYGGTGLGLTISKELAHLLGGSISLQSIESQGSRFTLEIPSILPGPYDQITPLPLLNSTAGPYEESKTSHPTGADLPEELKESLKNLKDGSKSILIVEDDELFRKSVAEAAVSYGFHTLEARDGESALQVLQNHNPSAILLDIKLPGLSGLGLLEMIKKMPQLRHVPIHMISAMEYQHNALRMGAVGFLEKPVTIDKVRSALEHIESLVSRKVRRLLIIEDDERQRSAIQELISGQDIRIESARSGEESLKKVKEMTFDCIILDLSLPDVSGFDLLDRLHSLDIPLPPIVIYTGRDLSRKEEEFLRRYSESIIIKGAKSPDRLLDEVNLFLHRVEAMLPEDKQRMLTQLRSQDISLEGKNILIVDDDLRNIFALTSVLEDKGLNVRIARDGLEAVELLEKDPLIEIVLMDIMMPKMDGYEAMRKIRKIDRIRNIPIIALTAKAMREDHERCIEAGANDYLQKPINVANLISVLKVWLAPKGIFS